MAVIQHDFRNTAKKDRHSEEPDVIPGYRLHLEIGFSSPPIWRQVDICGSLSLAEFSKVIQACFGFSKDSAHRFLAGKIFYGPYDTNQDLADETKTKVYQLEDVMGFIFTYLYDKGGGWECEIDLLEVFPDGLDSSCSTLYDGDRGNPPACMNDVHEYNELISKIEQSPKDRAAILAHYDIPPEFDPAVCKSNAINMLLSSEQS